MVSICVPPTVFAFLCVLWGVSLVVAFVCGVSFWAKHAKYNGVAAKEPEVQQVPQKPVSQERRIRSA